MLPVKKNIITLLEKQEYYNLTGLSSPHKIINILLSLSYDKTKDITWHAIEAVGVFTKDIAASSPETVRNIAGRLLWMLRDESGGIGWSCPEMLGEIVLNNPVLCSDIAPIVVSFHEEKMLTAGVLRAAGRIGRINNETVGYAIPIILPYLSSKDDMIRGNAAYALGELGAIGSVILLNKLKTDTACIHFYNGRKLQTRTVGEIASEALEKLEKVSG